MVQVVIRATPLTFVHHDVSREAVILGAVLGNQRTHGPPPDDVQDGLPPPQTIGDHNSSVTLHGVDGRL